MLGMTHVSIADRRKDEEERRKLRNDRIRRHENIRVANRDHPVFLSAKLRQQIQRLLQDDMEDTTMNPTSDDDDEDDNDDKNGSEFNQFSSDQQQYIEERLHMEGFTKRQARRAFEQLPASRRSGGSSTAAALGPTTNDRDDEEVQWENNYEECLQWLCVHLSEDQLPEGFDPRGSTLEIVQPTTTNTSSTSSEAKAFATRLGILSSDATWVLTRAKALNKSCETIFWEKIVELANVTYGARNDEIVNPSTLQEEMEALEAMFPEGLQVKTNGTTETIVIPTLDDLTVTIVLDKQTYPSTVPHSVICSGSTWLKDGVGVTFHIELATFLSTLTIGEPMIFDIFNRVQELQQNMEEMAEKSLLSARAASTVNAPTSNRTFIQDTPSTSKANPMSTPTPILRRPRDRGVFWSTHPSRTPAAIAYPTLGLSLERQRKSLPAFKAKELFLSALKEANMGSRVVLVTGETGSGKTTQIPQYILGKFFRLCVVRQKNRASLLRWTSLFQGLAYPLQYVVSCFRRGCTGSVKDCRRSTPSFGCDWSCDSCRTGTWRESAWSWECRVHRPR